MFSHYVRLYKEEDFAQVVEIAIESLRQNREDAEGTIRWASRSDSAEVFVTEADEKVVGFVMLEWPGTGWNKVAEIGWIAVLQKHQRKGFGSALLAKMEEYAHDKGFRKVYVEPSVENDVALHFFIKNGYKPEAMRKDWYKDGEDSIILGKYISPTH